MLLVLAAILYWVSTVNIFLQGTVVCPEGRPLKGLEVILLTNNEGSDSPTFLAKAATNAQGRFRLWLKTEDEIEEFDILDQATLQVNGTEGAGRIPLSQLQESDLIQITYPVIETVVLLHDNDLHFDFNHRDAFEAKVEEIRDLYEDVYLLNAGDIFVRNRKKWIDSDGQIRRREDEWYVERSRFMIETMNEIGYDVMTVGNHELEMIEHHTGEALQAAQFPILAANTIIVSELMPPMLPYVVFITSTFRKIAVLGLTTGITSEVGQELDLYDTVEKYHYLSDECEIFVALTHIGISDDIKLAKRFPEFDVIIGGHSHALLEKGDMINSVLVAQAGGNDHVMSTDYPKYLGEIIITLENGRIVNKEAQVYQFEAPLDLSLEPDLLSFLASKHEQALEGANFNRSSRAAFTPEWQWLLERIDRAHFPM